MSLPLSLQGCTNITAVAEQWNYALISGEGDSFLVADKIEVVSPYDLPFASFFVFYIPSRL